jgi:hypothetical protein
MALGDLLGYWGYVFLQSLLMSSSFFSLSQMQHCEEAGSKCQCHHANGNDANLAQANNTSSSIRVRGTYQLNY